MLTRCFSAGLLLVLVLSGCAFFSPNHVSGVSLAPTAQYADVSGLPQAVAPTSAPTQTQPTPPPATPTSLATAPNAPSSAAQPAPTNTPVQVLNPLTGLPVDDPTLLNLPPALVSISNFPVSARPQSGLSTSPLVFELYIGEGMTRFLGALLWQVCPERFRPQPR